MRQFVRCLPPAGIADLTDRRRFPFSLRMILRRLMVSLLLPACALLGACATTGPGGLPYAKKVPGKPGIVLSPHSAHVAEIDVSGMQRNEVVTDPFTGKPFLVP